MTTSERKQRRVVCAAVRFDSGRTLVGVRHWDALMRGQANFARSFHDTETQGFIDQHGEFMTREEALEVALAAGQRIYRCSGDETELYSENLY